MEITKEYILIDEMFTITFKIFDQDFKYYSFLNEENILISLQEMFNEHHMKELVVSNSLESDREKLYSELNEGPSSSEPTSYALYFYDREVLFLEEQLNILPKSIEAVRKVLVEKSWFEV
jgi:hypothetical protein